MCKCLERFDPTKNIKWTTFAYKKVFLYIKRVHKKEIKQHSYLIDDDIYIAELSAQPINEQKMFNEAEFMLEHIKTICTPEECRILDLKRQGYKGFEISQIMNCSTSKINGCMQSIKDKARETEL